MVGDKMNKRKIILFNICFVFFLSCFLIINAKSKTVYVIEAKEYMASSDRTPTKEEALNAVKAVARAYYHRGKNIQYASLTLTYKGIPGPVSQSFHQAPEYATSQNKMYLDCTSFTYLVYEQAFKNKETGAGYKLGNYGAQDGSFVMKQIQIANKETPRDKYNYVPEVAAFFVRDLGNKSKDEIMKIRDEFKNKLQPGDIIVYVPGKKNAKGEFVEGGIGHSMLYLDDDYVINVSQHTNRYTAINYQWSDTYDEKGNKTREGKKSTENPKGAVGYVSLSKNVLFATKSEINKYLFYSYEQSSTNSIYRLSILRPIDEITKTGSKYVISNDTVNRMKYRELVINKTSSINPNQDVNLGDSITYTIELANKSDKDDYNGIKVTDIIPTNTTYVSLTGGGTKNNNKLSWTINLKKGESKKISYTVKVTNDKNLLGKIVNCNQTTVNGIKINAINIKIKKTFTKDVQSRIKEIVNNKKGTMVSDNIASVVYKELSKNNIFFDNVSVDTILEKLFVVKKQAFIPSNTDYNKKKYANGGVLGKYDTFTLNYDANNKYSQMLVSNMYGGLFATGKLTEPDKKDSRIIKIFNDDLKIGDVLVVYDDDYKKDSYMRGEKNYYLYIGDGNFATVNSKKQVEILTDKVVDKLKKYLYDGKTNAVDETIKTNRSRILDSLIAQNVYVVLRPSYIADFSQTSISGDVDGNGKVGSSDYILVRKHILKNPLLTGDALKRADVNNDGKVSSLDYINIKKIIIQQ